MYEPIKYRRVLLKLSGEILAGEAGYGICPEVMGKLALEIQGVVDLGVQLGIVIGGGNIFRGVQAGAKGLDRVSADHMGMLATAMNAVALQNTLEQKNIDTRVMSAINMPEVAEPYIRRRAVRHMEKNRVIIFACGTGNPYFTTDTAASLRAMEIGAEILFKGTKVNAIFDKDPEKNADAKPYTQVSFMDVLQKGLRVMDSTAISLCMDNKLPIKVFNIVCPGNLRAAVTGDNVGTLVS